MFLTIPNTATWNGRAGSLPSFHQEPFWHGTMSRWAMEQLLSSDCPQAALDTAWSSLRTSEGNSTRWQGLRAPAIGDCKHMLQLCKKSLTCSECNSAWVSSQEHSCSSQFTSCRKGEGGGGILGVRERKGNKSHGAFPCQISPEGLGVEHGLQSLGQSQENMNYKIKTTFN